MSRQQSEATPPPRSPLQQVPASAALAFGRVKFQREFGEYGGEWHKSDARVCQRNEVFKVAASKSLLPRRAAPPPPPQHWLLTAILYIYIY
eukprot:16452202-Heterocapsa_arctica.AAC.1